MAKEDSLTNSEKEEIIEDFVEWSGGFTPNQCPSHGYDEPTHQSYVEYAMDIKFAGREEAVEDFLNDYQA